MQPSRNREWNVPSDAKFELSVSKLLTKLNRVPSLWYIKTKNINKKK